MTGLVITLAVVIVTVVGHSLIWASASGWHLDNVLIQTTDRARARERRANPPWYVRYAQWLDQAIERSNR